MPTKLSFRHHLTVLECEYNSDLIVYCYVIGVGQPTVLYPEFDFDPACFFAIGSPIGMFVTVRGFGSIGDKYELPTCKGFFNIFHPVSAINKWNIEWNSNVVLINKK